MAKYDPLHIYLKELYARGIEKKLFTFKEIEEIIGVEMEPSARIYFRSWDNTGGKGIVRQNSWLDADWQTVMVDMNQELIEFQHVLKL